MTFQTFDSTLAQASARAGGSPSEPVVTPTAVTKQDDSQGALQNTGCQTDLALQGPGFFVIQSGGSTQLTRNGSFTINADGQLVTTSGDAVMGQSGPISVDPSNWQIDTSGNVVSDGQPVDRLKIVSNNDSGTPSDVPDDQVRLTQGTLETSNVSTVREMVGTSPICENTKPIRRLFSPSIIRWTNS